VSEGPSDNSTGDKPADGAQQHTRDRVVADVLLYAAARLLLAVALTGVIYLAARLLGVNQLPIVVAALFALIIAMPLGIWVFSPLRRRATAALAVAGERRRAEREQLQARLRGEGVPDDKPDDEPDETRAQ
jgi:small-conductance mechanosensitive channel